MDSKTKQMLLNEANLTLAHLNYALVNLRAYKIVRERVLNLEYTDEIVNFVRTNEEIAKKNEKFEAIINEIEDIINT